MSVEHPSYERRWVAMGNAIQDHRRSGLRQFGPENGLKLGLRQTQRELRRSLSRFAGIWNHALKTHNRGGKGWVTIHIVDTLTSTRLDVDWLIDFEVSPFEPLASLCIQFIHHFPHLIPSNSSHYQYDILGTLYEQLRLFTWYIPWSSLCISWIWRTVPCTSFSLTPSTFNSAPSLSHLTSEIGKPEMEQLRDADLRASTTECCGEMNTDRGAVTGEEGKRKHLMRWTPTEALLKGDEERRRRESCDKRKKITAKHTA